ncbi:MAG: fibro-slime domain-containing protein [Candidatus Fibromonas sp.]|nr:fibro-slime domain-containing protein [Candidatus Fibromonas sp.]
MNRFLVFAVLVVAVGLHFSCTSDIESAEQVLARAESSGSFSQGEGSLVSCRYAGVCAEIYENACSAIGGFADPSCPVSSSSLLDGVSSSSFDGILGSSSSFLQSVSVNCKSADGCANMPADVCSLFGGEEVASCPRPSSQGSKTLDIIIRDFQVTDYGFEELDESKGRNGVCAGANSNTPNSKAIPSNQICFSGDRYTYCDEGGTPLKYGQDDCNDNAVNVKRGYCNGPDKLQDWSNRNCNGDGGNTINTICWSNYIYVTRGMVKEDLVYNSADCVRDGLVEGEAGDPDYIRYRYCARPQKGNDDCYGDKGGVDVWFSDNGGSGVGKPKRIMDTIGLKSIANGLYEVNYDYNTRINWNGYGNDRGFFPLDKYWVEGNWDKTWGPQSLSVYCPDISIGDNAFRNLYGWSFMDASWRKNCENWRNNGGPRDPEAAQKTGLNKELHNYGFSIAGSATFRHYQGAGDIFEFIGDDDMWIFIDGKLVADLGGTHLAAPAKINIDEYAAQNGWKNNSVHVINFFYMDRQSDGMNFKLKFALNDLSASRFR